MKRRNLLVSAAVLTVAIVAVIMMVNSARATCLSKKHQYSHFYSEHFCTDPEGFYGCLNARSDRVTPGGCFDPEQQRDYSCRSFSYTYHDYYELINCFYYVNGYYCTWSIHDYVTTTADMDPCPE